VLILRFGILSLENAVLLKNGTKHRQSTELQSKDAGNFDTERRCTVLTWPAASNSSTFILEHIPPIRAEIGDYKEKNSIAVNKPPDRYD